MTVEIQKQEIIQIENRRFKDDNFVKDTIRIFTQLYEDAHYFLDLIDLEKIKKTREMIHTLERFSKDHDFSLKFRLAAQQEGVSISRDLALDHISENTLWDTQEQRRKKFLNVLKYRNQEDIGLEFKIFSYTIDLLQYGIVDYIAPQGKPANWLLNILICVLVEHCKAHYPQDNHFSIIKQKFKSLRNVLGWDVTKKKDDPRQLIQQRYLSMKEKYNTQNIYKETSSIIKIL